MLTKRWCDYDILTPLAVDRRTSSLSESIQKSLLARPTWAVAVRQKTSFFCAQIRSTRVCGSYAGLLYMFASVLCTFATRCSLVWSSMSDIFVFMTWSTAKSGSLSSSGCSSSNVVKCCDSESAAW